MVARGVLESCRLAGRWLLVNLEGVCKAELAAGRDPTELRDALVGAWKKYQDVGPRLRYTSSAEKFFGEGIWSNPRSWPWRQGQEPAPPRTKQEMSEGDKAAHKRLREMQQQCS